MDMEDEQEYATDESETNVVQMCKKVTPKRKEATTQQTKTPVTSTPKTSKGVTKTNTSRPTGVKASIQNPVKKVWPTTWEHNELNATFHAAKISDILQAP